MARENDDRILFLSNSNLIDFAVTSCSLISLTIDTRKNDGRYFCKNKEWSSDRYYEYLQEHDKV